MFSRDEYFKKLINKLEKSFDNLYPFGIIVVLLLGIIRVLFLPNDYFALVDFIIAFVLIIFYVVKNKFNTVFKLSFVGFLCNVSGLLSYFNYGLHGTGIIILIISNLLMIIFSTKLIYRINFAISVIGMIIITTVMKYRNVLFHDDVYNYIFNIILFTLIVYILEVSLSSIKNYLLKNIEALDTNLKKNDIILNELALQNTAIKTNEKEIYNLAFFDQLTGLPKSNLFEKHVSNRLSQVDYGRLLIVDLKEFKLLNSIYGSQVGDEILKLVGSILKKYEDPHVYMCRLNGNEFGIWFESDNIHLIKEVLLELNHAFKLEAENIFKYNKIKFHVSYVSYPEDGTTYRELYNKLIIALNYGKSNEMIEYIKFEDFMEDKLLYDNNLKRLLENAILNKEFEVYYQEKYDSKSHNVIGVEALARWHSDVVGTIPPSDFVPMIAKYNMIESFERVIIEKVFSDYDALINKYGNQMSIGINISPDHLISKSFRRYLREAVQSFNVLPSSITLEITEEVMIKGLQSVEQQLIDLQSMGFKISLDDFGSGYSSLNYLAKLPFDEIKIDKAFIDQIHVEKVRKVLKTVIELKMIYDVNVIAEGVESQDQLDSLQSIGCFMIQGYLYSKPKPLS